MPYSRVIFDFTFYAHCCTTKFEMTPPRSDDDSDNTREISRLDDQLWLLQNSSVQSITDEVSKQLCRERGLALPNAPRNHRADLQLGDVCRACEVGFASTCKRSWDVALSASKLWTILSNDTHHAGLETYNQRNNNTHLSIREWVNEQDFEQQMWKSNKRTHWLHQC